MSELNLPKGEVTISVQAPKGSFLAKDELLIQLTREVLAGGAKSLRLARKQVIAEFAKTIPVIGLIKTERSGFDTRITQSFAEIDVIAETGCKVVAIDSTLRERPEPLGALFKAAKAHGLEIVADIDDLDSAKNAAELGANYIATTLAGYTNARMITDGPDFELLESLEVIGLPILLEGRVRNSADVNRAFKSGAYGVVMGRSVTSPRDIVESLFTEIKK